MAAKKANIYITAELEMAEFQLEAWKKYMEENPYNEVEDRKDLKRTKTGGSYEDVVQTKEAIQKNLRDTLKDYLTMTEVVNRLRQADEAAKEKEAKGTLGVPARMQNVNTKQ